VKGSSKLKNRIEIEAESLNSDRRRRVRTVKLRSFSMKHAAVVVVSTAMPPCWRPAECAVYQPSVSKEREKMSLSRHRSRPTVAHVSWVKGI
jgi:hypothetical protein